MKTFIEFIVMVVLLAALYMFADILHKGEVLNNSLPYPILGYVMWGVFALVVVWFVLLPIYQFCSLRRAGERSTGDVVKSALKELEPFKNIKTEDNDDSKGKEARRLYTEISNASANRKEDVLASELKNYQVWAQKYGKLAECHQRILSYAKVAGIAAAFSRNKVVDGLALFIVQCRMVIELAKMHGFKPSPVFNILCSCWILTNSIVYVLLNESIRGGGAVVVDMFADMVVDDPDAVLDSASKIIDRIPLLGEITTALGAAAKPVAEAVAGGVTVYVTGHVFLYQLRHEGKKLGFQGMLKLKWEARKALRDDLYAAVTGKIGSKIGIAGKNG